jgi:hypothetical protein
MGKKIYSRTEIKKMLPLLKDAYITEVNYGYNRGYHVRCRDTLLGELEHKYFSVNRYGSFSEAHEAAVAYRDKIVLKYRILPSSVTGQRLVFKHAKTPPGQNIGISLSLRVHNNRYHATWVGHYKGTEKKHYTINKYGYQSAYRMACDFREEVSGMKIDDKAPPTRHQMATHLRNRLGKDWQKLIMPAWNDWWDGR